MTEENKNNEIQFLVSTAHFFARIDPHFISGEDLQAKTVAHEMHELSKKFNAHKNQKLEKLVDISDKIAGLMIEAKQLVGFAMGEIE